MRTHPLVAIVFALTCVPNVVRADTPRPQATSANSHATGISPDILSQMGFAGMRHVSDAEGQAIRGKGFLDGVNLGQQVIAAEQLEYRNLTLAFARTIHFKKDLEFDLALSDFRQQLGPDFQNTNLSNIRLQVAKTVEFSDTVQFVLNQTSLVGSNLVFGSPIRITGGVFP
ncbi:MAG: hypothetical protein KDA92_01640 [Planctomycetales bacterium]|nr:hypothetical protein [Planctomycetales bacterium]MCA9166645.1 hypothetical protein [Planctomycetales bacterium]